MKLTLDARGLADALSMPHTTIQQYASRHPERLPARLQHEGRKLLWAVEDVQAWVAQRRAPAATEAPTALEAAQ